MGIWTLEAQVGKAGNMAVKMGPVCKCGDSKSAGMGYFQCYK